MALGIFQFQVVDNKGNVIPYANVEVRTETGGLPLADLFSDRDGETPISNPFTADSEGFAFFHAAGAAYKVRAYATGFERIWRYVPVGTNAEQDATSTVASVNTKTGAVTLDINDPDDFAGFRQDGDDAVERPWREKIAETLSVKDFGALCDGATDDTTAVQAALDSGVRVVTVPPNSVCIVSAITVPSLVTLKGAGGPGGSVLATNSGTLTMVTLGASAGIRDLDLDSLVTRTAGLFIDGSAGDPTIENISMSHYFQGILGHGLSRIRNVKGFLPYNGSGSYGIKVDDLTGAIVSDVVLTGAQQKGFVVGAGDTLIATNIETAGCDLGLRIEPGSGNFVSAIFISNFLFDSSVSNDTPTAQIFADNAIITGVHFSNGSFSNSAGTGSDGLNLSCANGGTIDSVDLSNIVADNNLGRGIRADSNGITGLHFTNVSAAGNGAAGIHLGSNLSGASIFGGKLGTGRTFGGNGTYGLVIEDTADNISVVGVTSQGNTSGHRSITSSGTNIKTDNLVDY